MMMASYSSMDWTSAGGRTVTVRPFVASTCAMTWAISEVDPCIEAAETSTLGPRARSGSAASCERHDCYLLVSAGGIASGYSAPSMSEPVALTIGPNVPAGLPWVPMG